MVIKTKQHIFIFEFKIDSDAKTAMNQILERGYHQKDELDSREVVLVGVNFDTKTRKLDDWCIHTQT